MTSNETFNFDELLNLNEVDSSEVVRSKIEPGEYLASVHDVKTGTSKTGNQYVMIQFEILEEPFTTWKIAKFFHCWHAKMDVAKRNQIELKRIFEALGGNTSDSSSIVGKDCSITVEHSLFGGKTTEQVSEVRSFGDTTTAKAITKDIEKGIDKDEIPF